MTDTTSRTIIISVIWFAVAVSLGIGLPLAQLRDPQSAVAVVFFVMTGATFSTLLIWLTKRPRREERGFEVVHPASVVEMPDKIG